MINPMAPTPGEHFPIFRGALSASLDYAPRSVVTRIASTISVPLSTPRLSDAQESALDLRTYVLAVIRKRRRRTGAIYIKEEFGSP